MTLDTPAAARPRPDDAFTPAPAASGRRTAVRIPYAEVAICLVLFALAMAPRVAWVLYNDREPQGLNDPSLYSILSDIMADGGGYTRPTGEPFAYYPVGFPATFAGLKKAGDIFGWERGALSIKMMNGVLSAFTVVLTYGLARRLLDRRVALVAGAIMAVFPSQVYYTGTVLSEPLFTFLLMAAMLVLFWSPWSRDGISYWRLGAVGLILSAATMTRGITLMLPLVLLAVWLLYIRDKKRALLQAAVLWAGIAVLIVPWSIRNSVQFGTLVGPSTNLGDDLCIGNFLGANGAFTLEGPCFEGYEGMGPDEVEIERNRDGVRIAVRDVLQHPVRMPKLIAQKAYWLLYKDDDGLWAAESYGNDYFIPDFRREVLAFAANSAYYAVGALAILGSLAFMYGRDVRRVALYASMLYILFLPLVFFGDPRFKFPAMPMVIVVAAFAVMLLWDRARARPAGEEAPS
ncbi:MAG TPA: glycosyltransferase family 39 protein [Dehalococcoidia bacterium]|nr:glycosyltransferase family 39 protein [Dehalococcoidia bacterium]